MPSVSVILPTCDRPQLWPHALASVLSQTCGDLEVVLVDSNRTTQPIQAFAGSVSLLADPRVVLVKRPHRPNASAARNVGLAVCRGEWVTYLDDDDEYRPAKVERQMNCAVSQARNIVLCGADIVLNGRRRPTQCATESLKEGELLNSARWATPLILHRNAPSIRFNEDLPSGEDAHFAHQLLAHWDLMQVPVVSEPLVKMNQSGPFRDRTNLQTEGGWQAARSIWSQFGARFSPHARRVFLLRSLLTREKLRHRPVRCISYGAALLRVGGASQVRFVANALLVGAGLGTGRFVT